MSKKIQLSVPKPCHENWEAMTPVEKGKFCGSCQKQVVDFSDMSDRQVAEFFKKPSTGSVCGRFMTDQLDREIAIPRKRIPFIKYFFQILIPAFFVGKASAQMGKVAATPVVMKDTTRPQQWRTMGMVARPIQPECKKDTSDILVKGKVSYSADKNRLISGIVTDEKGIPIPGASVMVKGTRTGVAAGDKGEYRIPAKNADILVFTAVGFERKELTITAGNYFTTSLEPLTIKGEVVTVTAGMVVCIKPEKKPLPKLIPVIKDNNSKSFKIFPNPLRAGEQLTIDWKRLPQGSYQMQWLDQSGQLIHEQPINVEAKSGSYRTIVPVIIAGSYFLVFTEKKTGKRFTEKAVIQ